jgi:signal transduction histidine kinase
MSNAHAIAAIDRLNNRAWELRTSDPQHAISIPLQAHSEAIQYQYLPGEARSSSILGYCCYRTSAYAQANTYTAQALAHFETLQDRAGQGDALNTLGNIHAALGDYHTAFTAYLRSLNIRQASGNTQAEAASWNNIGNVHFHLADYTHALEAHQKSLALKETLGDRAGMAISLNNIGNVAKARGDLAHAMISYRRALLIAEEIGHAYGQAGALSNLGAISAQLANWPAAHQYHLKSLAIEQAIGNRHGEAESLLQLGEVYLQGTNLPTEPDQTPHAQAHEYLHQALALADSLNANEISMRACQALAELHQRSGDFQQAFGYYQRFHTLERAIFDQTLSETTQKLQITHEVERMRRDAELQRAEAEMAYLKNTELAAALASVDQQRQLAEEANRFKTRLLSVAAHDLRNPLSVIRNYAELLIVQHGKESTLFELLEPMYLGAQRMEQMIHGLLELAIIEDRQIQLQKQPLDLAMLARAVVEMNQQRARHKAQTLNFEAEPNCISDVDEGRIWQVLDNLVSNAIKFSPLEKQIWVRVQHTQHTIRCSIRDEGPGLTAEDQGRIFGRLERLSATPTNGEPTTGLGLSIVKQLVELHDGRVWAESTGEHQGSTFVVELPAVVASSTTS